MLDDYRPPVVFSNILGVNILVVVLKHLLKSSSHLIGDLLLLLLSTSVLVKYYTEISNGKSHTEMFCRQTAIMASVVISAHNISATH